MRVRNLFPVILCVALAIGLTASTLAEATKVYIFPSDVPTADYDGPSFWTVDYFDQNTDEETNPIAEIEVIPENSPLLPGFGESAMKLDPGIATGGSGCEGQGGKALFGTTALAGRPVSSITSLDYSFLITTRPNSPSVSPYINIFIDVNDDGLWRGADDSILVYTPESNHPTPATGEWHTEVTIPATWSVAISKFPGITSQAPIAWDTLLATEHGEGTIADLKIVNPDPGCNGTTSTEGSGLGLSFVNGQKNGNSYNGMIAYIDAIKLTIGGSPAYDHVYDLTLVGPPANIVASAGNNQTALVSTAFPVALEVTVTDEEGTPLEGVEVSFTAPSTGASAVLSAATATTNAQGKAFVTATANDTAGSYNVTANVEPALQTGATFSLTNAVVQAKKPSKPVLVSPIGGAIVTGDSTPVFQWNANPIQEQVTSYKVVVFNALNVSVVNEKVEAEAVCVLNTCTLDLETLSTPKALGKGAYTWRVTAINEHGKKPSVLESFFNEFPGKPVLTSPIGNAVLNDVSPMLTWEEVTSAAEYRVNINSTTVPGLTYTTGWITSLQAGCNGAVCALDLDTLAAPIKLANGSYKWRVLARDTEEAAGKSKSTAEKFSVQFPAIPTLISPDGTSPVTTTSPTFTFSNVEQATEYRLVIVRKNNGKVYNTGWLTSSDVVCAGDTCSIDVSALETPIVLKKGKYKWHIQVRNSEVAPNKAKSTKINFTIKPS